MFRCLALHRGCGHRHLEPSVAKLYEHYNEAGVDFRRFRGVTLEELDRVEELFQTNVCVYKLVETENGKTEAELVRRSLCSYPETLNVNLRHTFRSYKTSTNTAARIAVENVVIPYGRRRTRCIGTKERVKVASVEYTPMVSVGRLHLFFQLLDEESIHVQKCLRYYMYRAGFYLVFF